MTKTRMLRKFRSAEYLEGVFQLAEEIALEKEDRDELGERYQRARLLSGLTQKELAAVIEYTERTVGAYEHGEVEGGLKPARKWAEATGVRYEWLVTGIGDPLPGSEGDRSARLAELIEAVLVEIRPLLVEIRPLLVEIRALREAVEARPKER